MKDLIRLSFLSFDALPLLNPNASGGIGGAEVRAVTFATGLRQLDAKRDARYAIDFVVRKKKGNKLQDGSSSAKGSPSRSVLTGGPARVAAFPVHYYQKPKSSLWEKLTRSVTKRIRVFGNQGSTPNCDGFFSSLQSDVLLCFGVRNDTARFVRAAKDSGKRSVVFLTSDRNIEDATRTGHRKRGIYGEIGHFCRYALMNADRVIAQTPFQQDQLRSRLHIESDLIRNPIDLDRGDVQPTQPEPPVALWVGRADTFSKRADLCLEIAKRSPGIRFRMVMNNHDANTYDQIQSEAPNNVEIIERVPFHEIERYFASATLLLNTSSAEGFPNSFLQAAKYGKPIVSLDVDPGEMLSKYGCGVCGGGDLDVTTELLQSLCNAPSERDAVSQRAVQYVSRFHRLEDRCEQLDFVLEELLGLTSSLPSKRAA